MEKRLIIDSAINSKLIQEILEKKEVEYESCNILYYVKEKYGISIVDMARVFSVTRQTMYNYFNLKSEMLPKSVKATLCNIYGAINFTQIIDEEVLKEYHTLEYLPLLESMCDEENGLPLDIPENYTKVYHPYLHTYGYYVIGLRSNFDFKINWNDAINESYISKKEVTNKNIDISADKYYFLKKNSKEYNDLLMGLLEKKVVPNDQDFLIYIMNYKK